MMTSKETETHLDGVRLADFFCFLGWVSGAIPRHRLTWWEAEQVANLRLTHDEWDDWFRKPSTLAVVRGERGAIT